MLFEVIEIPGAMMGNTGFRLTELFHHFSTGRKTVEKLGVTPHQQPQPLQKERFSENIKQFNFLEVIKRIFIQEEE